jgi:hypothetical protein
MYISGRRPPWGRERLGDRGERSPGVLGGGEGPMKLTDFVILLVEDDSDQVVLLRRAMARANLVNPLKACGCHENQGWMCWRGCGAGRN